MLLPIADVLTPQQVQQARQILNNARRSLYGLLAAEDDADADADSPEEPDTV